MNDSLAEYDPCPVCQSPLRFSYAHDSEKNRSVVFCWCDICCIGENGDQHRYMSEGEGDPLKTHGKHFIKITVELTRRGIASLHVSGKTGGEIA